MNIINFEDIDIDKDIKERVARYIQSTQNLLEDNMEYYKRKPMLERDQTFYTCAGVLKNSIKRYQDVVKVFFHVGLINANKRNQICNYAQDMIANLEKNVGCINE